MWKQIRTAGGIKSGAWFLTFPSQTLWSTISLKEVRSTLLVRLYPLGGKVFIAVCGIPIHSVKSAVLAKMEMLI